MEADEAMLATLGLLTILALLALRPHASDVAAGQR